jgi:DMSO/TMAO reductase YedYZ molybdopterin-dependent catalytic subunit
MGAKLDSTASPIDREALPNYSSSRPRSSRREFLRNLSLGLVTSAIAPSLGWSASEATAQTVPGKEGMILRSYRFLDLEMPMEFLNSWITPVPHFFVRNHMFEPTTFDAGEWRLTIGGEVEKPITLSLAELQKIPPHSVTNTLECAGNGRGFQNPHVPGIQWQRGAVGTAGFSGPRLRDVLERTGVKPSGKHVMFSGLDEVPGKVPHFIRSIPIEKAMDDDTLVALQMNGAQLTKHHGFPARALVPGWIGAASCKWLTEIKVLDREFAGNFMNPGYRFPDKPVEPGGTVNPEATHPVTALPVKSVIATPPSEAKLRARQIMVHGAAWAGGNEIAKVEVSTDSGTTWHPATLGTDRARYAWRLWSYVWKPTKAGEYVIMSRATDSQGRVQPEKAAWNPSGYLYNAIDQVKVHVEV